MLLLQKVQDETGNHHFAQHLCGLTKRSLYELSEAHRVSGPAKNVEVFGDMIPKEILQSTAHRPWPLPEGRWAYYQEWNDAIFLHWQVDAAALRQLVPEPLELDYHDGKAWVSVVAFTMEKIRPRLLPPFPPISNFHEINVRTYVHHRGKAGVYFLSIEGGKRLSCLLARGLSGLPYRYSDMQRKPGVYRSGNFEKGDSLEIQYSIGEKTSSKTDLDRWLTERYALFQEQGDTLDEFEIHHIEWPIHAIDMQKLTLHYPRFSHLISGAPDLVHYSPGVQVLAWEKTTCTFSPP